MKINGLELYEITRQFINSGGHKKVINSMIEIIKDNHNIIYDKDNNLTIEGALIKIYMQAKLMELYFEAISQSKNKLK